MITPYRPALLGSPNNVQDCCAPSLPTHLMSLGKVTGMWVGSGTGPTGSLMEVPTRGSLCATAKPATSSTATAGTSARVTGKFMQFSPEHCLGRIDLQARGSQ